MDGTDFAVDLRSPVAPPSMTVVGEVTLKDLERLAMPSALLPDYFVYANCRYIALQIFGFSMPTGDRMQGEVRMLPGWDIWVPYLMNLSRRFDFKVLATFSSSSTPAWSSDYFWYDAAKMIREHGFAGLVVKAEDMKQDDDRTFMELVPEATVGMEVWMVVSAKAACDMQLLSIFTKVVVSTQCFVRKDGTVIDPDYENFINVCETLPRALTKKILLEVTCVGVVFDPERPENEQLLPLPMHRVRQMIDSYMGGEPWIFNGKFHERRNRQLHYDHRAEEKIATAKDQLGGVFLTPLADDDLRAASPLSRLAMCMRQ